MNGGRSKRRLMGEINVVPYIDVMLVLLIIFMVTAPLLTQGVKVELPQADAKPISADELKNHEPVVLSVDGSGRYFLDIGDRQDKPLTPREVVVRVAAVLKHRPGTPVFVKGDTSVDYGSVVRGMVLLQEAGAPSVGLITRTPDTEPVVRKKD
ncbi:MAG: protein TolR [Gammaproteobacteria bacterium]|jgi:biopolymer transport protein TolR